MVGDREITAAVRGVVPVDPEQVARIGSVGVDAGERGPSRDRDRRRVDELGEGREDGPCLAEPSDGPLVRGAIRRSVARA